MEEGLVCTIDLRSAGTGRAGEAGTAGDELAACLERFLAVTVDEQTLVRSRAALTVWYGVKEHQPGSPVSAG
jgi:hypothetical protein